MGLNNDLTNVTRDNTGIAFYFGLFLDVVFVGFILERKVWIYDLESRRCKERFYSRW